MRYKGFRIDRKLNVYDLNDKLLIEEVADIEEAKEYIDKHLEYIHKKGIKPGKNSTDFIDKNTS